MALVDYVNEDPRHDVPPASVQVGDETERRYAACIDASKRVRWDIDFDVVRGREFDPDHKFLPDGLSLIGEFPFLWKREKRRMSQIQGRTYANVFGLVERFINAKVLEVSREHWLGSQTALHALIRFSDEELKHQELFRRIDALAERVMPEGYRLTADPDAVAQAVLGKSSWAVLGLTLHIELFTQAHYKESIQPDPDLSPLFKDVFHYHWQEERQHAVIDELEWRRCDARLSAAERDKAVDDLIELVVAVDGVLQAQARADAAYFFATNARVFGAALKDATQMAILKAYRWQYILSGAAHPHFVKVLTDLTTPDQQKRIQDALATLA
ncbi:MAG TPA: hypothetical protein VLN73_04010 [Alphaproteobacteria bacterium]|nr:hypothetical protein [Alphaproteobacteria bacterium]